MPNLGQIRRFLEPCDLEIWRMTLKNNRAPLLGNIKLCASFHHHMWIQTGVTVRKRLSWVFAYVTLTFDLWHWPFAWTSLLSLVITPENFMMGALVWMYRMYRSVHRDVPNVFGCIGMGARACDRHIPNVPTQTYRHIRDKMAVVAVSLATIPDSLATLLVLDT